MEEDYVLDADSIKRKFYEIEESSRVEFLKKYGNNLNDSDLADLIAKLNGDIVDRSEICDIINSVDENRRIQLYYYVVMRQEVYDIEDLEKWDYYYTLPIRVSKSKLETSELEKILLNMNEEAVIDFLEGQIKNSGLALGSNLKTIICRIEDPQKRIEYLDKMKYRLDDSLIRTVIESLDGDTKIDFCNGENYSYSSKTKSIKMPIEYLIPIEYYFDEDQFEFFSGLNFDYFNNEILVNTINNYRNILDYEWLSFLKFAKALGCFSDEKMLDKNGRETNVIMGQKATSLLRDMIRTGTIELGEFYELFNSIPISAEPNQSFLKFISQTVGRKKFQNLEMLLDLEMHYSGLFAKVMTNFASAEKYRESLDADGNPIKIPWKEAFARFYMTNKYRRVTNENLDIAEVFAEKGLSQKIFDETVNLREISRKKEIPEHILGKSIKEESILETIEKIKAETENELENGREIIEDLYSKIFTYEWLSKNDPRNAVMGLFVTCCGNISSQTYGSNIARSSIIAPDVQNLVVRDYKGNIISKGTMYVNTEKGYAVINDFELNHSYRDHQKFGSPGIYDVEDDSIDEIKREQIFDTFQRGLQAFIEEYDKQHPDNPLKQINVGMGYNRLKRQVKRFKKATNNLTVPEEYSFMDASEEQYILYQRDENQEQIEEKGIDE